MNEGESVDFMCVSDNWFQLCSFYHENYMCEFEYDHSMWLTGNKVDPINAKAFLVSTLKYFL